MFITVLWMYFLIQKEVCCGYITGVQIVMKAQDNLILCYFGDHCYFAFHTIFTIYQNQQLQLDSRSPYLLIT